MIIGLTGGIGSGKTTLLNEFVKLGAVGYIADIEAKILMSSHPTLIKNIQQIFGLNAYNKEGQLNSSLISSMIFRDKKLLETMNNMVRPIVLEDFKDFCKHQQGNTIIYESAILLESDFKNLFDKIITINADKEVRIERVIKRNGWSSEKIESVLNNQFNDEQRSELADIVIDGNDLDKAKDEVRRIYQVLSN